jgi:hypothetical protein
LAGIGLVAADDAGHALHVTDDVNSHWSSVLSWNSEPRNHAGLHPF